MTTADVDDIGLFDSANGKSLAVVKTREFGHDATGERLSVAYAIAERGVIAQIRTGSMRVHYFVAEDMLDADADRVGRWLEMNGHEAVRLIRENAPSTK
jgi:hypothetical protein